MSATTATPLDLPYIWATWLPRLLTGENSCEWQPGMYQRAYRLCTTGTEPVCSPEVKSTYRMIDVTYISFTESTDEITYFASGARWSDSVVNIPAKLRAVETLYRITAMVSATGTNNPPDGNFGYTVIPPHRL